MPKWFLILRIIYRIYWWLLGYYGNTGVSPRTCDKCTDTNAKKCDLGVDKFTECFDSNWYIEEYLCKSSCSNG